MKVYAVTTFSENSRSTQWPHTKLFSNKEEAYKYYDDIRLDKSGSVVAGDERGEVQLELGVPAFVRPRGKLIQVHDLDVE